MTFRHTALTFALFVCPLLTASGQDGKIAAAGKSASELKRTAHRMRISADRLKNIRDALQTAADLARRLDPVPAQHMNHLGQLWLQLNRSQAAATIESMLDQVRNASENTGNISSYQQGCAAFQGLLAPLSELDPEKAAQQASRWPRPTDALGEAGDKLRTQQAEQYQRQYLQQLIYRDPEKAASLYSEPGPSSGTDYSLRAQLALQLARAGQKDQAFKLVDGVIADYSHRNSSQNAFQDFTGFLSQITQLDPGRFLTGLSLISNPSSRPTVVDQGNWTMKTGDQSLPLSNSEYTMLQFLRGGFSNRPGLLFKTLDTMPDLKSKLEAVGGIDNLLNPDVSGGGGVSFSYSSSGGGIGYGFSKGSPYGNDKVGALQRELRGKAESAPASVRQKLSEAFKRPDDVDFLLNLAQRASYEDPELAALALEVAKPIVLGSLPFEKRAMLLQNLVRAYRNCDGEVDKSLLQEGFILADQLRQADKEQESAPRTGGNPAADQLEQAMIAEYAADDFVSAMTFMRAMPDGEAKLATCLRIVESLRQNF